MNCLNQDSQDDECTYLKRARRNRDQMIAPTGKRVSLNRRLLILEILLIPKILIQTDEYGQAQCLSDKHPRKARLQSAPTGDLPGI